MNLTTELSTQMAHLSSLQMELTSCRQREAELKTQLASAVAENHKTAESWASLKQSQGGRFYGPQWYIPQSDDCGFTVCVCVCLQSCRYR